MAGAQANINTYLAPLTGSGRTAPALLQDLTLYDPHFHSQTGYNLLADGPINFRNSQHIHQYLPETRCRHVLCLQPRQTKAPALDERPSPESIYQVTAVCQRCRVHVCMKVDYTVAWKGRPCPNEEYPVHHLIRSTFREQVALSELARSDHAISGEVYAYQCSSPTCSAVVTTQLIPEFISQEAVHTLTANDFLKERTDAAFAARSGDTEGMRRPSATDVLTDLRTYLRNTWKSESRTEISVENKRFAVRFGPGGSQCSGVLQGLGFKLQPGVSWQVPQPTPEEGPVLTVPLNIFLDNVEYELSALILGRPESERQAAQDTTRLDTANMEFSRILGCQNYDRTEESRTTNIDASDRAMPYTVLGVPQDSSDDIISKAYDWQCNSDASGCPHYLSALQSIAMLRSSEILDTKCAIEQSNGRITQEQLIEAYKSLGLSMNATPDAEHIIGTFESRAQDARGQEPQLRESLRIIGVGLNNNRIIAHAAREISTYDQALTYLGVQHDTSDEFIQSMYTLKVTEHAAQQDMAAKAVQVIARYRQSDALDAWITSGFTNDTPSRMDLGEAYQTLEISDRTMDDDTILAVYNVRKTEVADPDRFVKALTAIAESRQSPLLFAEIQIAAPPPPKANLTEPVGLDNIGNTCYLNSLLQFLFTMKAVRDIVLDFGGYRMSPTPENMAMKKVGQRKISAKEVETAQKFVSSLATLFQTMITAPKTTVRPEQELARLTLETDQVKEKIRRRSTLAGTTRPSLGSIDNKEVQGPLPPPLLTSTYQVDDAIEEMPLLSPEAMDTTESKYNPVDKLYLRTTIPELPQDSRDDNSSEATLVSRPNSGINTPIEFVSGEQQQMILDDKENLAPSKLESTKEVVGTTGEPLRPASPSKINSQAGALAVSSTSETDTTAEDVPMIYAPPPGPPPIPPRKPAPNPTSTLEEYARQQDVTEVVGHCLFQLSCAMRPTGFDKSGEQQDEVHDLFFGESREHIVPEKDTLSAPLPFLNIQASLINQPRDVYAALDNYFDLSDIGNGRRGYQSITRLPPVLTVTLGRVIWDSRTNSQKKLDHHVQIPETLYMDRYLEATSGSKLVETRRESWRLKQELADLADRKSQLEQQHAESADVPTLFDDARRCLEFLEKEVSSDPKFGGPVDFDPDLKNHLGRIAEQKRAELETAKSLINLRNEQLGKLFADMRSHPYRLHAAFFHRGSHGSGHYWVYIFDHKRNLWRKYNDDHVNIVANLGEIFDKPDATGGWSGPANPYFLVYVAEGETSDKLESIVETVKRDPLPDDGDSLDGINIEPLGTGSSAIAEGYMSTAIGRARSQLEEMPPEVVPLIEPRTGPSDTSMSEASNWIGQDNTAGGQHTVENDASVTRHGNDGGWRHTEANTHVKW